MAEARSSDVSRVHVTRAPFFKLGDPPQVGTGGVEVALSFGTRSDTDTAITLNQLGPHAIPNGRWKESIFDKRNIAELDLGGFPDAIPHTIAEQTVSREQFAGFRKWSGLLWWAHHGMEAEFITDAQAAGLDQDFLGSHTAHRLINGQIARYIKNQGQAPETVMVQDPYYFPQTAKFLKENHGFKGCVVGVNHIPFPSPEDFQMFQHLSPQHWEKLARSYMNGWTSFDVLSFHTNEDAGNFMRSADKYATVFTRPEIIVNPLGVDGGKIERTVAQTTPEDMDRLSEIVLKYAPQNLNNIDQLSGKDIGIGIGYRSDPIKNLPLMFQGLDAMLEAHPEKQGEVVYVQQIRPHRIEDFESYRQEYEEIKSIAESINKKYGRPGWQPIILIDEPLAHEDVIKMQHMLATKARRSFTLITSIEGMNMAGQEAFYASQRNDFGLITTTGCGLGKTLRAYGATDLLIPEKLPETITIAYQANRFLDLSDEEAIRINAQTRDALQQIAPPARWLERIVEICPQRS